MSDADRIAELERQLASALARLDKLSELTLPLVLDDMRAKMAPEPEPAAEVTEPEADPEPTEDERLTAELRQAHDPAHFLTADDLDAHLARKVNPSGRKPAESPPALKPSGLDHLDKHLAAKYG